MMTNTKAQFPFLIARTDIAAFQLGTPRARYTRLGFATYLGNYHTSDIVHTDPQEWLQTYRTDIGFEGRLDLIGDGHE
jgi:hypothetical protein